MPRSASFNEKAMDEKIKINLDRGFTMREILSLLLDEAIGVQKSILTLETRAGELSDQIDYLKEKHFSGGIKDEKVDP